MQIFLFDQAGKYDETRVNSLVMPTLMQLLFSFYHKIKVDEFL